MSDAKLNWSGGLAWLSFLTLLVQQAVDAFAHGAPVFIWVLKLLPLLIFIPGMVKDSPRTYIWVCFVSLGYFIILVQRLFADPADVVAIIGMVAVVLLFVFAMLYARWRSQANRHALDQEQGSN